MFPISLHYPNEPQDLGRELNISLLKLLHNETEAIAVMDRAWKDDLYFIRVCRQPIAVNVKYHELYVAKVRFEGNGAKRQTFFTLYDLGTAPLDTARCPRELTTRLTVTLQNEPMQAWLAANNAHNDAVVAQATFSLGLGEVMFLPSGIKLHAGNEFFLGKSAKGVFKAIPEEGRQEGSTCVVPGEEGSFFAHHGASRVTVAMLDPVLDPQVRAMMKRYGEFLVRPTPGNSATYELAGRMPSPTEMDQYRQGRLAGLLNTRMDRQPPKRKVLFL